MSNEDASTATPSSKDDTGFRTSLSALRKILLLDSPTATMLQNSGSPGSSTVEIMERARLKKELRLEKQEHQSTKGSLEKLQQQLQQEAHQLEQARSNKNSLENSYKALDERNRDLLSELETIRKGRDSLEAQVFTLERRLKHQQEQHSNVVNQLNVAIQEETKSKEIALQEVGRTEAHLATNERRLQEMEREAKQRIRTFATERTQLQGKTESLDRSNAILRERMDASDTASRKYKKELAELKLELDRTKIALNQAESSVESSTNAEVKAPLLQNDNGTKPSEIESLQETTSRKERELQEAKKRILDLEETVEKQRVKYESTNQTEATKGEEYGNMLSILKNQLKDVKAGSEKDQSKVQRELADAHSKLNDKVSLLERKDKVVKLLKDKVKALERKLIETESSQELASLRQELEATKEATKVTEIEWTNKLNTISEELAETRDELQCAEDEVKRCREKISQLQEAKPPLVKQEEFDSLKASAERQLQMLHDKLANSEAALETARSEALSQESSLKEVLEQSERELQEAKNAGVALKKEVDEKEAELESAFASRLDEMESSLSQAQALHQKELERRDEEAKCVQGKLEAELNEKNSELETKESRIRQQEEIIESLEKAAKGKEPGTEDRGESEVTKDDGIGQSEEQWTSSRNVVTDELAETKGRLKSAESELAQYRARVAELEEKARIHDELGEAIIEELSDETDKSNNLEDLAESLQPHMMSTNEHVETAPDQGWHAENLTEESSSKRNIMGEEEQTTAKKDIATTCSEETVEDTLEPDPKRSRTDTEDQTDDLPTNDTEVI